MRYENHSINHSLGNDRGFLSSLRYDTLDASDRRERQGILGHVRVYMARRFLARSATTTVTTLPPVNQRFYSVNCRALTSVSH